MTDLTKMCESIDKLLKKGHNNFTAATIKLLVDGIRERDAEISKLKSHIATMLTQRGDRP
jgi:hypothetical protein